MRSRKKAAPAALPEGIKQDNIIIFTSVNGREPWHPVKPEEVPEWVKHPDNMAKMLSGEECMKCDEGVAGSAWYRAVRLSELNKAFRGDH